MAVEGLQRVEQVKQTDLLDEMTWRRILAVVVSKEFENQSRRQWRRYPVEGELKAEFMLDDEPRKRSWYLFQISAGGLTVKSEEEIPLDTELMMRINLDGTPIPARGQVRHCTQTLGGYKLGIKILFAGR